MVQEMQPETFRPFISSRFKVSAADGCAIDVTLESVDEASTRAGSPAPARRAFTLLFRAATKVPFAQQICRVEHPELGPFELFLVPVGPDAESGYLEAVFA